MRASLKPAVLALLAILAPACGGDLVRVRDVRTAMGTYVAITLYAPSEASGREAINAAFSRVKQVEGVVSTWQEGSDASKLIRSAGGPPILIDEHLYTLLSRSLDAAKETDGAFDVTAAPLIRLWKRAIKDKDLPSEDELRAARALVGYKSVRLLPDPHRAQLSKEGMRVDFGGIGKGYIIDQAINLLREHGISAALVDAGGDVYALGRRPGRDGWLVGIRDPQQVQRILPKALLVQDCATATSGDYEQFTVIDGRRYSHIIDPRRGRPVEHVSGVTVIAPDATRADAYATAATVLGPERAVAFAEKHPGVEVLVLTRHRDKTQRTYSSGFARYEIELKSKP